MIKILMMALLAGSLTGKAEYARNEPAPAEGLTLPTATALSAAAGMVEIMLELPDEWPPGDNQTLFHVGDRAHTHVTLFFREGSLTAVYKADEQSHSAINHNPARKWAAASKHRVQLLWQRESDDVSFYLRVDGTITGFARGVLIKRWPEYFNLGHRAGGSRFKGKILGVNAKPEFPPLPEHQPGSRVITVDTSQKLDRIYNFWSIVNYTRQDPFTNASFRASQKISHPFMRYVNCVRLLGGRHDGRNQWFKGVDAEGRPVFEFDGMVAILQGILDAGYQPRIVLDNVPLTMSGDVEMEKYGNTYPPEDYALWELYVEKALQAMVDAFGIKRVSSWRFRVGTEPDLHPGHWIGTQEQYQHHYARTTAAVLRVIPNPDIGPGNILDTKLDKWGLNLVDFIATNNLPMTFFSSSWYGRVGESQQGFEENVITIRNRLNRYERFHDIPFEVAEFAILNDEYNRRLWNGDVTEWGASWYAGIAEKVYRLNVAQVHQWATTTLGIFHPRTHIHTMLGKMSGGRRLSVCVSNTNSVALAGAIAAEQEDSIFVLLYNHRPLRTPQVSEEIHLRVLKNSMRSEERWKMNEWLVDREHGVFIHEFIKECHHRKMKPLPDTAALSGDFRRRWGHAGLLTLRDDFERYRELGRLPMTISDRAIEVDDGKLELRVQMKGHSVRLLQFTR
jgi:xylan 1,4-beta-xylosidase